MTNSPEVLSTATDTSGCRDTAIVLTRQKGSRVPRALSASVITLPGKARLLISRTKLRGSRILLKRVKPHFDSRFVACRLLRAKTQKEDGPETRRSFYCYGLQVIGERSRHRLTRRLYRELVAVPQQDVRTAKEPRKPSRSAKKHQESLMPFLSALGLAVVYAANLHW